MIIGVNVNNQIKQIANITDPTLKVIELDENSFYFPFKNWTRERVLCYCYEEFENGFSVYPYVNTDKIKEFETEILSLQAEVVELEYQKALEVMENV